MKNPAKAATIANTSVRSPTTRSAVEIDSTKIPTGKSEMVYNIMETVT